MDLGLEIDKAIQSVKEDDKPKTNKKRRSKKRNKKRQSTGERVTSQDRDRDFDASSLSVYFQPTNSLLKGLSNRLGSEDEADTSGGEDEEDGRYLFAEEIDSESSSSDDDSDIDFDSGGITRPRIARDVSSRNMNLRYMSMTGNLPPDQLSVAPMLSPDEMEKLTSGENFGVVFFAGYAPDSKKKKKKKNRRGELGVSIVPHEFHGMSATGREEEDGDFDADEVLSSTLFLSIGERNLDGAPRAARNGDLVFWPPPAIVDDPAPPTTAPPRERGSGGFLRSSMRASWRLSTSQRVVSPPSASSRDLNINRAEATEDEDDRRPTSRSAVGSGSFSTSARSLGEGSNGNGNGNGGNGVGTSIRATLMKQPSKVRAPSALTKGVNLLAKLYPTSARNGHRGSLQGHDRFITAKGVNWVIPPPPVPHPPPPDHTDAEQAMLDRELLDMFVEDLRSTLLKLEDGLEEKTSSVSAMQAEIDEIDDEIAELLQPKDVERHYDATTTSQLKSVTSGKIFRVEKYES